MNEKQVPIFQSKEPLHEEISGEVLRITYHDADTLFTVAKIRPIYQGQSKDPSEIAIVGKIPNLQTGHVVYCQGTWTQDLRHGKQFQVEKIRLELPKDPHSIQKLLSQGFIKGVGPKTAEKIVAAFGEKTFFILEKEPHLLFDIPGLSSKKAKEIIELWQLHTLHQETLMILLSWGLTQTQSLKALKQWGHKTLETVQNNPYLLAQDVHGIGFIQADKIAKQLRIPLESPQRIQSAILFFLTEIMQQGHTCAPLSHFLPEAQQKLGVQVVTIEEEIAALLQQKKIALIRKNDSIHIAPIALHLTEFAIASDIKRLQHAPCLLRKIDIQKAIVWAQEHLSMQFSEGQKEAIKESLEHKLSVITGGPGTGKSTITKALLAILSYLSKKITLAAPTGRAAKRLMEITGHHAHTIHRLLKFEATGFHYKRDNPLTCDILIVDEMSMVDTFLMGALFQAIPNHAKVILVGDVNQLPSIGPGTVLKDIIQSSTISVAYLRQIYRQSKRSNIVENAHRVNNGQMPWLKNFPGSDFLFFEAREPDEVRQKTFELVTRDIPIKYGFDPRKDIQILSPMRRGTCGIDQFNSDFQAFFSRGENTLPQLSTEKRTKLAFLTGDKVIQLKNNYSKEVFNGDIGSIEEIDQDMSLCVKMDDRIVPYEASELEELHLAWAVSVHKYQGSEAPCIVIPIHTQHFTLLTRNLLYTALTRGKKLVILIGSVKALAIAIKNTSGDERWTYLQEAIRSSQR